MGNTANKSNEIMVDNLVKRGAINRIDVERAFRLTDRGRFIPERSQSDWYRETPLKILSEPGGEFHPGPLHISAPEIYARILNEIDLLPGHTFLNIGSGTGYLNTIAGFLLGSEGVNHGMEHYPNLVVYSEARVDEFVELAPPHAFSWSRPRFFCCNALCEEFLKNSPQECYDRIYCGASLSDRKHINKLLKKLKIGGKMIVPTERDLGIPGSTTSKETVLLKYTRIAQGRCLRLRVQRSVYADLVNPPEGYVAREMPVFDRVPSLRDLCRSVIRGRVRSHVRASGCNPTVKSYKKEMQYRAQERRSKQRIVRLPDSSDSHFEVDLPHEDPVMEQRYPAERPRTPQLTLHDTRVIRDTEETSRTENERQLIVAHTSEDSLERLNRQVDDAPFDNPRRTARVTVGGERRAMDRNDEFHMLQEMHRMMAEIEVYRDRNLQGMAELRAQNQLALEPDAPRLGIEELAREGVDAATRMETYLRIHREEEVARREAHHTRLRLFHDEMQLRGNRLVARGADVEFLRHAPREEDLEDGEEMLEIVDDYRIRPPGPVVYPYFEYEDGFSSEEDNDNFDDDPETREDPRRALRPFTRTSSSSAISPSSVQEMPSSPSNSSLTTTDAVEEETIAEMFNFPTSRLRLTIGAGPSTSTASNNTAQNEFRMTSEYFESQLPHNAPRLNPNGEGPSNSFGQGGLRAYVPRSYVPMDRPAVDRPSTSTEPTSSSRSTGSLARNFGTSIIDEDDEDLIRLMEFDDGSLPSEEPSASEFMNYEEGSSNSQPSSSGSSSSTVQLACPSTFEIEVERNEESSSATSNDDRKVSRELTYDEVLERQQLEGFQRRNRGSRRRRRRDNNFFRNHFLYRGHNNAQLRAPDGLLDGRPRPVAVPVGRFANGEMTFVIPALPVRRYHTRYDRVFDGASRRSKRRANQMADEECEAAKRRKMEDEELDKFLTRFTRDIDTLQLPSNLKNFLRTLSDLCN